MSAVPRRASVTAGSVLIAGRNDLTDYCIYPRLNAIPFSNLAQCLFSSGLIENAPFPRAARVHQATEQQPADRLRIVPFFTGSMRSIGMQQPVIHLDLWRR